MSIPSGHPKTEAGYIPAIDGLRAVAVVAIILFHLDPAYCPGGFVGVDTFFVISGFVVAQSASRHENRHFLPYVAGFFRRRILRIYPALFVFVLLASLWFAVLLPAVPDTNYIVPTGLFALFGASNILLYWMSGDYFADAARYNAFTHTWSVGVEFQYYLAFPIIAYGIATSRKALKRTLIYTLLFAMLVSLLANVFVKNTNFNFYMLPARFWELGLGYLLFIHRDGLRDRLQGSVNGVRLISIAGALLTLVSLTLAREDQFPFPWAIPPCLGVACQIAAAISGGREADSRVLASRPFGIVGRISYSLYLWHWPVIVSLRWFASLDDVSHRAFALLATIVLSFASYALIERPFRTWRMLRHCTTLQFYGGFTVLGVFGVGLVIASILAKPVIGLSVTNDLLVWSTTSVPKPQQGSCRVGVSTAAAAGGRLLTFEPSSCEAGETPKSHLFIVGDSHAGAYWRLAYNMAMRYGVATEIVTKGGCALLVLGVVSQGEGCEVFRSRVLAEVGQRAHAGDVVFVTALYTTRFRSAFQDSDPANSPAYLVPAFADDEVDQVLASIGKSGARVVFDAPKPMLRTAQFRCADPYASASAYCLGQPSTVSRRELYDLRAAVLDRMWLIAEKHANVTVWDSFAYLCPTATCGGYLNGQPIFYDTDHLTGYGNDLLTPHFVADVLKIQEAAKG